MFKVLSYNDTYMPLLCLILYIILWKDIDKKDRVWFYFFIYNILLYGCTNVLGKFYINNLVLYHFANWIELMFVVFIIARAITGQNFSRQFWLINIPSTLFCVIDIVYWEPWNTFNSIASGYAYLIIIIYSMYFLFDLSKSDKILYFQKLPIFWFVSAFLVYCTISLLAMASYRYFLTQKLQEQSLNVLTVNVIAIFIKFAMISIGLLCYKRPNTQIRSLL
ncbi:hypothetical protein [Deminuibacter soli]|uniref:Uncharacterized protein n=1 Tax=Deminuibacter soli TaxID=2291815 RepID=A0A3E1NQ93_9BACT|nr:hypothetical protein [Deminuibacter soli]RFM29984.1 hypothetical protein DXN05_03155 [Deminuibacter soli]